MTTTRIITLLAPASMTTTQFPRQFRLELSARWQQTNHVAEQNLRLNWVVVTGADGTRTLRMQWTAREGSI